MGLVFGVLYDAVFILESLFKNKVFVFFADLVYMIICSFAFVCFLIGYNNGEMRTIFVLISLLSLIIYMLSLHKISKVLASKLSKLLSRIKKSLKNAKINKKV